MAALTSQLEAAEQRLADLERQRSRLEQDRGDAGRLTQDAAKRCAARARADRGRGAAAATTRGARRSPRARPMPSTRRTAELALAQATAAQAGVEAEWRVAEAELGRSRSRLAGSTGSARQQAHARARSAGRSRGRGRRALRRRDAASGARPKPRSALEASRRARPNCRPRAMPRSALAAARAELAGVEREHAALLRDREAREKQAKAKHGLPHAIDRVRARPAMNAPGRGPGPRCQDCARRRACGEEGRFWTGAMAPAPVPAVSPTMSASARPSSPRGWRWSMSPMTTTCRALAPANGW
jgi:chromosome segregation protein